MNKFSRLLCGIATAGMLFSCAGDEPDTNGGAQGGEDSGSKMYLNIKINDANTLSRGNAGGYAYGEHNEHNVNTARFFFFDSEGHFITEAKIYNFGGGHGTGSEGNSEDVEYFSENVIVLQGLTGDNLPQYLITMLNAPEGFKPPMTIAETALSTLESIRTGENFIMSTTSFYGGDSERHDDKYYYATKLKPTDFKDKPEDAAGGSAIDIYVERLAAKFTLAGVPDDYKEIVATVAGEDNGDIGGTLTPEAGTKLYVKFDKWGLTGTEKKSHLSKNLDGFTATTDFGFDWNDPAYHRSFWGKSVSYNSATPDLNIVTDREVKAAIKDPAYSMECTNIPNYIRKTANETSLIKPSLVTSAILTATVYEKDETAGTYTPVDLVLYNGVYYKKEQFIKYALSRLDAAQPLNFYICTNPDAAEGETRKYRQVTDTDVKLAKKADNYTGSINLAASLGEATTLYAKAEGTDGKDTFTAIEGGVAKLNERLAGFTESQKAVDFKNGKMFYTIPVEHMLNVSSTLPAGSVEKEGNYGVVRNHWYQITVNQVVRLGHGIFLPDDGEETPEPLIPEDPDSERFALGARINVLSWKIVKQTVDL